MRVGLVERAMRGDEEAFSSLAAESVDRCYALAYRILRDSHRAQDATQQALLGAWRDLPTLKDAVPLRRLAVQADRQRLLHRGAIAPALDDADPGDRTQPSLTPSPTSPAPWRRATSSKRAFRTLSPERRAIVVLHHHLGFPLTEIAETLGIPVGTARSRLHYAVRQLRAALAEDVLTECHVRGAIGMSSDFRPRLRPARLPTGWKKTPISRRPMVLETVVAAVPSISQRRTSAHATGGFPTMLRLAGGGVAAIAFTATALGTCCSPRQSSPGPPMRRRRPRRPYRRRRPRGPVARLQAAAERQRCPSRVTGPPDDAIRDASGPRRSIR